MKKLTMQERKELLSNLDTLSMYLDSDQKDPDGHHVIHTITMQDTDDNGIIEYEYTRNSKDNGKFNITIYDDIGKPIEDNRLLESTSSGEFDSILISLYNNAKAQALYEAEMTSKVINNMPKY